MRSYEGTVVRLAAVLFGAMSLVATSGAAQELRRPATLGNDAEIIDTELSLSRTVELAPISMAEILGGTSAFSAARSSRANSAAAAAVSLGTWSPSARGTMPSMAEAAAIRRSVRDAWQLRVETSQRRRQHFDVAYALHALNGASARLSHAGDSTSQIRVRLEPITPVVVATDGEYDVLQGGVVLHLDLSAVRRAGQHQGLLTVTFNNF